MIFLDTGPLVAVVFKRDEHHQSARNLWKKIDDTPCLTTNLVLVETANILSKRIGGPHATKWVKNLYRFPWLRVYYSNLNDEIKGLSMLPKWWEYQVGLADAVSFVAMDRHAITKVWSYDRHFTIAGYERLADN